MNHNLCFQLPRATNMMTIHMNDCLRAVQLQTMRVPVPVSKCMRLGSKKYTCSLVKDNNQYTMLAIWCDMKSNGRVISKPNHVTWLPPSSPSTVNFQK